MPPSRRSSSSRSSRSRSSSRSSSRSRSSSSSRRSSSSHSSYRSSNASYRSSGSRTTSTYTPKRTRRNQPTGMPSHVKTKSILLRCKNHDYMYVNESWMDEATGVTYNKGYYDENGKYYGADTVAFKKPDGSYEAHYECEYCGTELEANWKEGFYPSCKNCGAEMKKTPVFIDEILNVGNTGTSYNDSYRSSYSVPEKAKKSFVTGLLVKALIGMLAPIVMMVVMYTAMTKSLHSDYDDYTYSEPMQLEEVETNLEIYGTDLYLDEVSPNTYRICTSIDEYEKHLTWDYGAQSYYDYDSNCYLWYNTDVSPNLWQYWYDDIAGDSYYGWMECEGDDWYIETSDTDWALYEGDTSNLWHIENPFDE